MKSAAVVAYVPVLHRGYIDFFDRNMSHGECIFILGDEFIEELMPFHKEIRGLDPGDAVNFLTKLSDDVSLLTKSGLHLLSGNRVVLPSEEISKKFAVKYLPGSDIRFDEVFLRWDESSVFSQKVVAYDRISDSEFDRKMMKLAEDEASKSSDWWRHVGAVATMGEIVLFANHNQHVPSEHTPYAQGDPRDYIQAGQRSELSTALHGEQVIILRAAREGVSLKDASIYVTVFPCPVCAKLIAYSGISKCYFGSGHANLDGESIMRSQGVEIIQVA